ncbi:hypothetical protein EV363DRAFT_928601 [Boletus edulis]|nr:hypothetical protein EV363DRAFT_928601 [Boletus edulis]
MMGSTRKKQRGSSALVSLVRAWGSGITSPPSTLHFKLSLAVVGRRVGIADNHDPSSVRALHTHFFMLVQLILLPNPAQSRYGSPHRRCSHLGRCLPMAWYLRPLQATNFLNSCWVDLTSELRFVENAARQNPHQHRHFFGTYVCTVGVQLPPINRTASQSIP